MVIVGLSETRGPAPTIQSYVIFVGASHARTFYMFFLYMWILIFYCMVDDVEIPEYLGRVVTDRMLEYGPFFT